MLLHKYIWRGHNQTQNNKKVSIHNNDLNVIFRSFNSSTPNPLHGVQFSFTWYWHIISINNNGQNKTLDHVLTPKLHWHPVSFRSTVSQRLQEGKGGLKKILNKELATWTHPKDLNCLFYMFEKSHTYVSIRTYIYTIADIIHNYLTMPTCILK